MRLGRPSFADFCASLVVFLVALPLCVAIAKACKMPTEAGLITGIIGGIVTGILCGSPLQVSGPAAGLIVLLQMYVNESIGAGDPSKYVALIMLAGLIQIVAGIARLGQWFRAVSPAVVLGMLAGIGVIILVKQFHVMFDQPSPEKIKDAITAIPDTIVKFISSKQFNGILAAGVIGLASMAIILLWKPAMPKKVAAVIPAAVVAVLAASILSEVMGLDVMKVDVSPLLNWFDAKNQERLFSMKIFQHLSDPWVWKSAGTLALIASAETLLCATAVDAKHTGPRTQYNQELFAQGLGNMLCGALGALPMTGVIVRSSANVDAGAKTRWSAVFHGVWLLIFAAFLPFLLTKIPIASLAAVLVITGFKLLEIPSVRKLWKVSKVEVAIYLITLAGVVFIDLLWGVIGGILCTALYLLWKFSNLEVHRVDLEDQIDIKLDGAGTFLGLPKLASTLENLPRGKNVHVHLDDLSLVDHSIFELLMKFRTQYESTGGNLFVNWEQLQAQFKTPKGKKNGGK